MTTVTIPKSIETVQERLTTLGRLAQATDWERSAIIRAFCEKSKPGPKGDRPENGSNYSLREFAELGFAGLKKPDTVRRYFDSWDLSGLDDPERGAKIQLPEMEFPSAEELKDLRERQESLETFAREHSEGVSQLVEYDQNYWYLLPQHAVDQLVADTEAVIEFLASVDQEALKKLVATAEGMVEE